MIMMGSFKHKHSNGKWGIAGELMFPLTKPFGFYKISKRREEKMHLINRDWIPIVMIIFILLSFMLIISIIIKSRLIGKAFDTGQKNLLFSNLSTSGRTIKIASLLIGLFFICFSLLDPRWGSKSLKASIEGIDIVLAMDVSRSMLTPDVYPSRLENAKKLSLQLMSLLIGNRIGITAFAGFAFNVIPLTTDYDAASVFLNDLSPDMIDVQGTNLEDAIKKALELFEKEALTHKAIVIFTDGEDYEFNPLNQIKEARDKGIAIFTIGIGTPVGGQIPLYDERGNIVDYLKKDGQIVTSHLNETMLRKIAMETGGTYFNGNQNAMIELSHKLDEIKKSPFGTQTFDWLEPQFQYFLLIGILFLLIALLMPERRIASLKNLFHFIILTFLIFSNKLYASDASRGTKEYRKGNYEEALKLFQKSIVKNPKEERLRFNEGNSLYQLQKLDEALKSFSILTNSRNKEIENKALYNLGNTFLEKQDYNSAINAYKKILQNEDIRNPIYQKALQNLLYAKQQLRQQQSSMNNQQKKDDKNKNESRENKDEKNNNKNQAQDQEQIQQKPLSPSETENLLNVIAEEEKKHLGEKQKVKGRIFYPKNEW